MDRFIPGTSNRLALPNGEAGADDHVGENDTHQCVTTYTEPSLYKYSKVQKQNGGFGKVDGKLVKDLRNIE